MSGIIKKSEAKMSVSHHAAGALTRTDLTLNQFPWLLEGAAADRSVPPLPGLAKSRFHPAGQFQPQGFEDFRPLRSHWVDVAKTEVFGTQY
jgi:hypothetical protein